MPNIFPLQGISLLWLASMVICANTHSFNTKYIDLSNRDVNNGLSTFKKVLGDNIFQTMLHLNASFRNELKSINFLDGFENVANYFRTVLKDDNATTGTDLVLWRQQDDLAQESSSLLSENCTNAMDDLFELLISGKYQKIEQLLDAMGKPGSGINQGNLLWLGSFRECKATSESHYCLSQLKVLQRFNVMFGLCLPKECSQMDAFKILQVITNMTRDTVKIDYHNALQELYGSPVYCQKKSEFSAGAIAACTLTAVIAALVFIGTILDYCRSSLKEKTFVISKSNGFMPVQNHDEQPLLAQNEVQKNVGGTIGDILLCFSLRRNAAIVLNTSVPANAITSLNGIRTLSMFWVILGHTFFFALSAGTDNILQAFKIVHRFSFQAVANAYFSVDTFFVLSGLLVSYLCMRKFDSFRRFSFIGYFFRKFLPLYYVHRFLRLTPSYMYVILFYLFLLPFCGDGPLWFEIQHGQGMTSCEKYWWTNLLYINNFYPTSMGNECIGWSWYLANDMQFYIISPIILLVMYKLRVPGTILINGALCVISFAITGYIIGHDDLNALLTVDFSGAAMGKQAQHFANWIYSKPYCRIPPYLVGLALGYLLHNRKMPKGNFKYLIGISGWSFAVVVGLAVTFGPYTAFREGGKPFSSVENILYGTFSRFSWGLCVAWVIYACHFEMGGVINTVLSWKAFVPLSRLTYGAYLVHPIIIYVFYNSFEKPLHFSDISIVFYFTSFITMTYATAFLLAVFVEFPAMNLEKLVF